MTGVTLLAASLAAVAAFLLARGVVSAPMRLATRIAPYTSRARQRLGTIEPVSSHDVGQTVWAPILAALSNVVATIADAGQSDTLEQRLRNAGMGHLTAEDYRRRQLAATAAGAVAGITLAVVLQVSVAGSLALVIASSFFGLTRWRAVVERRTEQRRTLMQAEAHILCQLLAIYLRTGDTPMGALDRLTARAHGVIPDELATGAILIRRGAPAEEVLEQMATTTAERYAARLYRLYGATWQASGDPTALMALAEVLRAGRPRRALPPNGQTTNRHGAAARHGHRPDPDPVHRCRHPLHRSWSLKVTTERSTPCPQPQPTIHKPTRSPTNVTPASPPSRCSPGRR